MLLFVLVIRFLKIHPKEKTKSLHEDLIMNSCVLALCLRNSEVQSKGMFQLTFLCSYDIYVCVCVCVCVCTLLTPWSLPGSSVHGISQARILEWVAMFYSRESSRPRDRIQVSCVSYIAGGFFFFFLPLCHLGSPYICKDFTTLTLLTLGWIIPFCGGRLMHCRMLTPSLTSAHWVPAASAPPPPLPLLWQTKMSQISSDFLWGWHDPWLWTTTFSNSFR